MSPVPSYGEDALESWRRRGATMVQFWCTGAGCGNRIEMPIEDAIVRWQGGTSLVMLARRARCHWCGRQGCHVQVTARDAFGHCRWVGEAAEGQGDPRGEHGRAGSQEPQQTGG